MAALTSKYLFNQYELTTKCIFLGHTDCHFSPSCFFNVPSVSLLKKLQPHSPRCLPLSPNFIPFVHSLLSSSVLLFVLWTAHSPFHSSSLPLSPCHTCPLSCHYYLLPVSLHQNSLHQNSLSGCFRQQQYSAMITLLRWHADVDRIGTKLFKLLLCWCMSGFVNLCFVQ